ncbi:glutaredoxin 3 [Parachitinimonas caeni]|uniref:Glutaredoxin n=1 Tax=Parachitinimonas caeni TaxID=3031301 RepID=A0ABT7DXW0_9NEIS|nr:glutaredoxin 3 [Parachitinimonas caeni]MDK2124905.1 glutaredoxin 3 [Parachitinimonas caeni]
MPTVIMYTTNWCPYCQRAKQLLQSKGVTATEINIEADPAKRDEMMQRSGRRTVPQIFIGDHHVGGFDDLAALDRQGGLMPLLQA